MRLQRWLAIGLVLLAAPRPAAAELWGPLESYVFQVSLIVRARAVGREIVQGEVRWTFEPIETWKGTYRRSAFAGPAPGGGFFAADGEHGVNDVEIGMEVVFFFVSRPDGKIGSHSTAFPIRDGTVVYASTAGESCAPDTPRGSGRCAETFPLAELKNRIVDHVRAQKGCRALLAIRNPRARARRLAPYLLDSTAPDRCGRAFALRHELVELGAAAVPHVAAALRRARPDDRIDTGVAVLGLLGPRARAAVPTLLRLLARCETNPRWPAAAIVSALGDIGDRRAIEAVRAHLTSSDEALAGAAERALRHMDQ